jgi:HSP20 family protein
MFKYAYRPTRFAQAVNRLFDESVVNPQLSNPTVAALPLNVMASGEDYVITAAVPGLKAEDLEVQVEQGILTISGRTEAEQERKERNYLVREQRMGRFTRSLQLPPSYNTDNCESQYEHGVLRLVFPKAEEAKPRRIQIGTGAQRSGDGQPGAAPQFEAAGGARRKPEDRA